MKKLTLLGSTGSIGLNTLDVVRMFPEQFSIEALSCRSSIEQLIEQIREFHPKTVCVDKDEMAGELKQIFPNKDFVFGMQGLEKISTNLEADLVVSGIVGAAGLKPTFSALKAGKTVVLANKEPLVMAGELFMQTAIKAGAKLLPADSEHNAIFQALNNEPIESISRLFLTASGGSLREKPLNEFENITPAQALDHPNWKMGSKITIDSATMMNKGLEIIEAHYLFGVKESVIDVVIHPQSIVHSLVSYLDGSVLAQLAHPDMKIPIAYTLSWPKRMNINMPRLDLSKIGLLEFHDPDKEKFPALRLARESIKSGGSACLAFNAANEIAVAEFLAGKIRFTDIVSLVEKVLEKNIEAGPKSIEDVILMDNEVRKYTESIVGA